MTTNRLDTLIDRLIDFDANAADLDELAQFVRADDESAGRLNRALAAERILRTGMCAAERRAAFVQMNTLEYRAAERKPPRVPHLHRPSRSKRRPNIAFATSWSLTAASLAFAAFVTIRQPAPAQPMTRRTADAPATASLQPAGPGSSRQILGAFPPVAVGMRQTSDGNIGLVYIRAQIEQADVADLYRVARDEHGRPVPVRVEAVAATDRRSM